MSILSALTVMWLLVLLALYSLSLGIFFYLKGYVDAGGKALKTAFPLFTDLFKESATAKFVQLREEMEKVNLL